MAVLSWLWGSKSYRISEIVCYPVKSCGGVSLAESEYTETGLLYDRHWMIVEAETLTMCTARVFGQMLLIETEVDYETSQLHLHIPASADGTPASSHSLPLGAPEDAELISCKVHQSPTDGYIAADAGHPLSKALSAFLGKEVMVLRKGEHIRESAPNFLEPLGLRTAYENLPNTAFADAFPLLLATTASLADLRRRIEKSRDRKVIETLKTLSPGRLAMKRFRPNVVIDGEMEAFEEDGWQEVSLGGERCHIASRCTRCPMPNVDPVTGIRSVSVPAATLTTYRVVDVFRKGSTCFGVNGIPHEPHGTLRVGDSVDVISRFPRNDVGGHLRPEDSINWNDL